LDMTVGVLGRLGRIHLLWLCRWTTWHMLKRIH
jgi:hypothetical protein